MMLARVSRGSALLRGAGCRGYFSVGRVAAGRSVRCTQPSLVAAPPSKAFRTSSKLQWSTGAAAAPAAPPATAEGEEERITNFAQLSEKGLVNPRITDAITKGMRISDMTEVQSLTINEALKGADILAQAKTGTGKTLAFLVPVVQRIAQELAEESKGSRRAPRPTSKDIRAIIVSPTRELAEQIYNEAVKVVRHTRIRVGTAVGGSRKRETLNLIRDNGCHLLIGTPGRLIDVLSDPRSGVDAPKLSTFVLDEADRLLDIGFAPDIERMQEYLPPRSRADRQTLLFSATVPRGVMDVVSKTMKPDFNFVQTVKEDEVPTHLTVPQKAVFLRGLENQLPAILELAKQQVEKHRENPSNNQPFKAIVYFNSTAEVSLARTIFETLLNNDAKGYGRSIRGITLAEMHSGLTQSKRNQQTSIFRRSQSSILFSSDVTARGMDFPNVSHVIQIGSPRDRETYIHRLGRTARANKTGEGWLFLTKLDYQSNPSKFHDLPIQIDKSSIPCAAIDMTVEKERSPEIAATLKDLSVASRFAPQKLKEDAHRANASFAVAMNDKRLGLDMVHNLAVYGWGMESPPEISLRTGRNFGGRGRSFGSRSQPRRSFGFSDRQPRPDFGRGREPRRSGFDGPRGRPNSFGNFADHLQEDFTRSREPRRPSFGGPRGRSNRDDRRHSTPF